MNKTNDRNDNASLSDLLPAGANYNAYLLLFSFCICIVCMIKIVVFVMIIIMIRNLFCHKFYFFLFFLLFFVRKPSIVQNSFQNVMS